MTTPSGQPGWDQPPPGRSGSDDPGEPSGPDPYGQLGPEAQPGHPDPAAGGPQHGPQPPYGGWPAGYGAGQPPPEYGQQGSGQPDYGQQGYPEPAAPASGYPNYPPTAESAPTNPIPPGQPQGPWAQQGWQQPDPAGGYAGQQPTSYGTPGYSAADYGAPGTPDYGGAPDYGGQQPQGWAQDPAAASGGRHAGPPTSGPPYGPPASGPPYQQQPSGPPYAQQPYGPPASGPPYGQQASGPPYGQQASGPPYGQQQDSGPTYQQQPASGPPAGYEQPGYTYPATEQPGYTYPASGPPARATDPGPGRAEDPYDSEPYGSGPQGAEPYRPDLHGTGAPGRDHDPAAGYGPAGAYAPTTGAEPGGSDRYPAYGTAQDPYDSFGPSYGPETYGPHPDDPQAFRPFEEYPPPGSGGPLAGGALPAVPAPAAAERYGGSGRLPTPRPGLGTPPPSRRRLLIPLAIAAVLVLLVVLGTGGYLLLRGDDDGSTDAKPRTSASAPAASASASPSPTASVTISSKLLSRATDPKAMTLAELSQSTYVVGTGSYVRTGQDASRDCRTAVDGAAKSVVVRAQCNQVVSITAANASTGCVVTFGVLNLPDAVTSTRVDTAIRGGQSGSFLPRRHSDPREGQAGAKDWWFYRKGYGHWMAFASSAFANGKPAANNVTIDKCSQEFLYYVINILDQRG